MSRLDQRFDTLDGMRGVAAILVVAYHLMQRHGSTTFAGYLAVDFFFLLSGFVIAFSYHRKLAEGLSPASFMAMRMVRLFPLYAAACVLGIGKQAIASALHDDRAMSAGVLMCSSLFGALMLPSPCTATMFPLNMPTWSLFFELAINVAFAVILWRLRLPVLAIVMAVAAVYLASSIAPPLYMDSGWLWTSAPFGAARTAFSFIGGMLIYRVLPLHHRRASWLAPLPLLGLIALLLMPTPVPLRPMVQLLIVFIAFPALLLAGICLEARPGVAGCFRLLGNLSYPLYALHAPLIALILPILTQAGLSPLASMAMFVVVMLPIAHGAAVADGRIRAWIGVRLKLRRGATRQPSAAEEAALPPIALLRPATIGEERSA